MLTTRQSGGGGSQTGSNQNAGTNSASGILSTIIPSFLVGLALVSVFVFMQKRVKNVYLPRTYLAIFSDIQRIGWGGFGKFAKTKDVTALYHHGLDAYLFLRFWRLAMLISLFALPLTWIVLMPVYGTSNGGQSQLDKISFSNIDASIDANRLYAVSLVSMIVMGATMIFIFRERLFCFKLTIAYENATLHSSQLLSRTLLLTDRSGVEGSTIGKGSNATHEWPAAAGKDLQDLRDDQTKIVKKLEKAIVKWVLAVQKDNTSKSRNSSNGDMESSTKDRKHRPTSRFISWKMIGRKVDVIDWCYDQLKQLAPKIKTERDDYNAMTPSSAPAVFVEYKDRPEAVRAFETHQKQSKNRSLSRTVGTSPKEIIWQNIEISKKQRSARLALAVVLICLLIIFWVPFTAVIGAITNINYLVTEVPFLSFINNIPSPILGIVTGLLPAILLSLLLSLVPFIMRLIFKMAGCVTTQEIELRTQKWYFIFQVIQVFLVTTISSGAAAVAATIVQDPTQAVNILASNLPKASNFYISYLVLQGIAVAPKELLNIFPLAMVLISKKIDKTPRQRLIRYTTVGTLKWGTLYPKYTLFIVIAVSYSCIAPLILLFAALGFFLLYTAYRYLAFYSTDTTALNTHGQAYAMSLQQMMTGVYLAELCLIGLMGIDAGSSALGAGPLVLNVLLLIATIAFHVVFNMAFKMLQNHSADLVAEYEPRSTAQASSDNSGSFSRALQNVFSGSENEGHSSSKSTFKLKVARTFVRLLRVPTLDLFPSHFADPSKELSDSEYETAFVHPAAQYTEPRLWIPKDQIGIASREMSKFDDLTETYTTGAELRDKELKTNWTEAASQAQESEDIRNTPFFDDIRKY